jgi:protein-S-isoprenylcysteine O-methyltransferase Ste14
MFYAGVLLLLLLGAFCLWSAHREYEAHSTLSHRTVIAVVALHALHAALTGFAAWHGFWRLPIPGLLAAAFGVALLAQGAGFALAAAVGFGSLRQTGGLRRDKLVCSGAYAYSRNPQSVGWMLALLGIAVLGRSGMAVMLVAIFWVIFRVYVALEEQHLERVHGDEYRQYRASTPRYFGLPKDAPYTHPESDDRHATGRSR